MRNYILRSLWQMALTILLVSLIVFVLIRLRGDPATQMAPPEFTPQQVEDLRRAWGLDRSLPEQYLTFLQRAIVGDFGRSVRFQRGAMEIVLEKLPWTYLLAIASAGIALVIAMPLGVISAIRRNGALDLLVTALATLGAAMPSFWFGLMLLLVFAVTFRALPAFGAEGWQSLVLPATTLALGMTARLSRLTRSAMLDVLGEDYVRTARSKGLREQLVIYRHALRNALIPVMTAFGLQLGWLLGGAVVVEQVFAWPGIGRLMIEAIAVRDVTVVQAALFWFALSFMLINLIIDVLYTVVDPRIRYS